MKDFAIVRYFTAITALLATNLVFGQPQGLINMDLGVGTNTQELGPAAVGVSGSDFWNFYSRDDGAGGYKTAGSVANLHFADGSTSGVGMTILNGPGAWGNGSSDYMFATYLYPLNGGNLTISLTNLPPASYDFYVYGQDARYQITVGGADYGTQSTPNAPIVNPVSWQEGVQYVVFRNVNVAAGQSPTLTVRAGAGGYAVISGFQFSLAGGVAPTNPPTITAQPASASVYQGSSVTFNVGAAGAPPFTYQWYFKGAALAGATSASLGLSNVQSTNAGAYQAVVSNPYGSATSAVATLTVTSLAPVITNQPQSLAISAGSNALFTVGASGPSLRFQWMLSGTNIPGAFRNSYSIANAQPANSGNYSVRVYNQYGAATSSIATLNVLAVAPVITQQPVGGTFPSGTNLALTVGTTGSLPLYYQWQLESVPLPGATTSTLTLTNVQPTQSGNYSVIVSNSAGATLSSNALVTIQRVNHAPVASPQTVAVNFNGSAPITLTASDSDGDSLTFTVTAPPAHGTLSGSAPSLIYQAASGYSGPDSFTFTANDGQTDSAPATVSINVLADGTLPLISLNFGAGQSSGLDLQKTGPAATGHGSSDAWNFYSRDDGHGGWLTAGSLPNLFTVDGLSTSAGVTVLNGPGAWGNGSDDPMYNSYIYPFDGGNLTVTLTNVPTGAYDFYVYGIDASYELLVNDTSYGTKPLPNGPVSNPVVWQEDLQYALFRTVRVEAGDTVTLTVRPGSGGYATLSGLQIAQVDAPPPTAPVITQQPASLTVAEGSDAMFSVAVSGTSPFRYQWRSNGVDVAGAAAPSLTLHNVGLSAAAAYSVVVSNAAGSAVSDDAVLTVTHVNHLPVADSKSVVVSQNGSAAVTLSGSDPDGDALAFTITAQPAHGTLSGTSPNLVYQAQSGFSGLDSFSYVANDGQTNSAAAVITVTVLGDPSKPLLNVDFGAGASPSLETGPAAVGQNANDFWNFYSRDDGYGNWLSFGSMTNLKYSDQTPSAAGLTVANAPGAWGNGSSDPMYASYIYPLGGGNVVTTITNLPTGQYDIYVYGIDSSYSLSCGSFSAGPKLLPNGPVVNPVSWQENLQFVRFQSVPVVSGQPLVVTVQPGASGYATLSGLQILGVTPTNHPPVANAASVSVAQDGNANLVLSGNDPDGDALSFSIASLPTHGTLSGTPPNVSYAPFSGFSGSDSFTFTVNDGTLESAAATVSISVSAASTGQLLDVAFGAGTATAKTGPAATGLNNNDYWNFYTRDDGHGGWLTAGALGNLKFADGTSSAAGLTVLNAPGAWGDGSSDPMYASYIYPLNGGNATVTVTNLSAGSYDVYVYSIDARLQLSAGALSYGTKQTTNAPVQNPVVWHEGEQYVLFSDVQVTNSAAGISITVLPGSAGYAVISGIQIMSSAGGSHSNSNSAPVAYATLPDALPPSNGDTNLVIVSGNGSNAAVVLDGSQSSDPDADPLTWEWFEDSLTPFATGPVVTNVFAVGMHHVTLVVSDGQASASATLDFEVITTTDAVAGLAVSVESSTLDRTTKRQLEAVLLENSGNTDLQNLEAFQAKVQNYVAPAQPATAAALSSAAQSVMDAASKSQ